MRYEKRFSTIHFPMGLGLIAGAISSFSNNLNIKIYDNYVNTISINDLVSDIYRDKPDFVLMNSFLGNYQYKFIKNFINKVSELSPGTKTIIGGPMATSIPDLLMRHSKIDYVVVGEGEETIKHLLIALMNRTDTREVKGIYGKDASEIFSTGYRPRIKLLSASHKTPYEIFDIDKYVNYLLETERCWEIITSRGCYGKCNFCHRSFGKHITYRDLSEVVNEMKFIKNKYNIDRFSFVDDNFLINERRAEEFICILKMNVKNSNFVFKDALINLEI